MNLSDPGNVVMALPIEIKARALDARTFLAMRFLERGYKCLVGAKVGVHKAMDRYEGQMVYFDKGLDPRRALFYRKLRMRGGWLVALDEEGAISIDDEEGEEFVLRRNHPDALKYTNIVFTWGEKHRKIILEKRKSYDSAQVIASGHPRFDLRKPRFSSLYDRFEGNGQPVVVVATNFSTFNANIPKEEVLARFRNYTEVLKGYYTYQEKVAEEFILLINGLREKLPDWRVVVRPHPVENPGYYKDRVLDGVEFDLEGSVHDLIVKAEALIHHDCTTGIEAILHGTKAIAYCPMLDERFTQRLPRVVSQSANTIDDVIATLLRKDKVAIDEEQKGWLKEVIQNVDTEATDLIVDKVVDMVGQGNSVPGFGWSDLCQMGAGTARRFGRRCRMLMDQEVGEGVARDVSRKFASLSLEEMQALVKKLGAVQGSTMDVDVSVADDKAFWLTRKG